MPKGIYKRTEYHREISIRNLSKGMLGKKHTKETKKRMSEAQKRTYQNGRPINNPPSFKDKKHSLESRKKTSEALKGRMPKNALNWKRENHPNWKGGITPIRTAIWYSYKYKQWRSDVFERDNYTCQNCGIKGGRLEAHHIKRLAIIIKENKIKTYKEAIDCEEIWDINNGQTLCYKCHNLTKFPQSKPPQKQDSQKMAEQIKD